MNETNALNHKKFLDFLEKKKSKLNSGSTLKDYKPIEKEKEEQPSRIWK